MKPSLSTKSFALHAIGISLFASGLTVSATSSPAQVPCDENNLSGYFEKIRTETIGYYVKTAAECVVKLSPTRETAQILVNRLVQTLQETRRIDSTRFPYENAEIVAALAEALYNLKTPKGYEMIADYFMAADWNTPRDREFFDTVAAHGHLRSELTETFYLGLTRMPATAGNPLGRACGMFNRINDRWVIRDEPRFIHGVLGALSRIEKATRVPNLSYLKESCEKTLLTQLLNAEMRKAFMVSSLDLLTPDERKILDGFLSKITSPADRETTEQFAKIFLSTGWNNEMANWQQSHPDASCETFHGKSFVTDVDDLWCSACQSKSGSIISRYFFYPESKADRCTLQKVRFSYPSADPNAVTALTAQLSQRMGPATPQTKVQDFGSAFWEEVASWTWQKREVYAFRNRDKAWTGEGLPMVEILARDHELTSTMKQEEAASEVLRKEKEQHDIGKKERLYHDAASGLPDLIHRLEKTTDPESKYTLLIELLQNMSKEGPDRAAQLYLANGLAIELGWATYGGNLKDWEAKQQALSAYGIAYEPGYDGISYNRNFLRQLIKENLSSYWAEEAFLDRLRTVLEKEDCKDIDLFKRVINRGENFLKSNPQAHNRNQVMLTLAEAHETGWSLSLASPEDEYVKVNAFNPKTYEADAPKHQEKAIFYYEQFLKETPSGGEAELARIKLKRIRMDLDTNSRDYVCLSD